MLMMSDAKAEENHSARKISFEKCPKVIALSEDKLSIAPEIQDVVNENVFRLNCLMERLKLRVIKLKVQ